MKNVVLIGLGMVADTHAAAMAASKLVQLHGVMSTSPDRAHGFAQKFAEQHAQPAPKVYRTIDDVIADSEVDFVDICTPPNARLQMTEALATAGLPILMEKPIERDLAAAEKVVDLCEAARVPLGLVLQHRLRESSQLLADMINEGALGELALFEICVPWWRPQAYYDEPGRGTYARDGGGVLISQAIHTLDLALMLLGPVRKVQAMATTTRLHTMESEDFVVAGLEFESDLAGSFIGSTASYPGDAESIKLHGTKGSATLQSGQLKIDWQNGKQEILGEAGGTGGGADPMAFTFAWHQGILEDFAAAIDEKRSPIASGREVLNVHRLITAMTRSSTTGRAILLSELDSA